MKLTLGFSPCPNDTFIFDALVNKKIDTEGLDFQVHIADVEELNNLAIKGNIDITKLSCHAYYHVADKFMICRSGAALGHGNGPLLVSKRKIYPDELPHIKIAIPGKYTTAAFLLKHAFSNIKQPLEYLFSDIEDVVLSNETDAGVLIHETRFTYETKGLKKIADLGELWEKNTLKAIPLGLIAVNRQLPDDIKINFAKALKNSVNFAVNNPGSSRDFIKKHAQNPDPQITSKHIDMFVNKHTVDLGEEGKTAIEYFLNQAEIIYKKPTPKDIFVTF